MAKRTAVDCDGCLATDIAFFGRLPLFVDRVPDQAGGMEDIYE